MESAADSSVLQEIARLQAAIERAKTQPQRGRGSHRGHSVSTRRGGSSWQRGGNRSLILSKPPAAGNVSLPAVDALSTSTATDKQSAINSADAENVAPAASTSREVIIDGVTFASDVWGNKLIRKGGSDAAPVAAATPPRASVNGQTFVRTKNGNLIALSLVNQRASDAKVKRINSLVSANRPFPGARGSNRRKGPPSRRKVDELCRFFTTTGQCRSGLTCAYQHDPDKLAICPRFLRGKCSLGEACPLSHKPDGHRMPHCVHFPNCKHGTECRYPHVHVSPTAGICKNFAPLGYCEKGLACPERHVRECPEFSEKGTCSTQGCRLPHIIRKGVDPAAAVSGSSHPVIEYASDSDEEVTETPIDDGALQDGILKRSLDQIEDHIPSEQSRAPPKQKRRRLHDSVVQQADFLTFDDSFEIDYGSDTSDQEDHNDIPASDVDSDVTSDAS